MTIQKRPTDNNYNKNDENDVKKVQQLEKKLQGMLKEVDKTMKGSGLSAPAFNNVRSGIVKGLQSIQKFYKIAKK